MVDFSVKHTDGVFYRITQPNGVYTLALANNDAQADALIQWGANNGRVSQAQADEMKRTKVSFVEEDVLNDKFPLNELLKILAAFSQPGAFIDIRPYTPAEILDPETHGL